MREIKKVVVWDARSSPRVGKALHRKGVTVANMDATANDLPPGVRTQGYPTLKVLDVASFCSFRVYSLSCS